MNQSNIHVRYNFEETEEELAGEFEISNSKILNFARRGRKVKKIAAFLLGDSRFRFFDNMISFLGVRQRIQKKIKRIWKIPNNFCIVLIKINKIDKMEIFARG